MLAKRLTTLQQIAAEAALDAIALVPGPNLFYLTGQSFHLMERPLLGLFPSGGDPAFIIPQLELNKLDGLPYPVRAFPYSDAEGHDGAFAQALAALALDVPATAQQAPKRLGVEGLRMRFLESQLLARYAPDAEIVDAGEALAALRLRKDADEVAAMQRAIAITEDALRDVLLGVRAGMSERAIANDLQIALLRRGGQELPFPPIVLTGPQSALPHGVPGERTLQEGDLLLIDFGTTVEGYASDLTRTFVAGELQDPRLRDAYLAVLTANEAARLAAGPSVPCQEVDRAARAEIIRAGFGEYFIHRTGHGLGLDAHEAPYIRQGNEQPLEPGHVFTVEPGVYLPGVGGVRIEDNVLITEDGAVTLTSFPRELQSVGA